MFINKAQTMPLIVSIMSISGIVQSVSTPGWKELTIVAAGLCTASLAVNLFAVWKLRTKPTETILTSAS